MLTFLRDSLRTSVEAATGGKVTVLYDDKGNPSYMRVIPRFNCQDIDASLGTGTFPAFVVNGSVKSEIFIGQYQAIVRDGRAISIPGVAPGHTINFDQAKAACTSKGPGWHLMTNWEWAALMMWCLKNDFQPRGNTNHGRHHLEQHEQGVRVDGGVAGDPSGFGNILNGSGPASWRHDNTASGISDLVGNVWEWQDGLKLVEGQFFMPDDNHYTMAEGSWPATGCFINSSGQFAGSKNAAYNNNFTWGEAQAASGFTPDIKLKRAGLVPMAFSSPTQGRFYINNSGERLPLRGGSRYHGGAAGLGALFLAVGRSTSDSYVGLRPAFIQP